MHPFNLRTITEEDTITDNNGSVNIKVMRTRNSQGFHSITIRLGDTHSMEFQGDSAELQARKVIELLQRVLDQPCECPSTVV